MRYLLAAVLVLLMAAPATAGATYYADNPDHRPSVTLLVNGSWLNEDLEVRGGRDEKIGNVAMVVPSIGFKIPVSDAATVLFGFDYSSWSSDVEPGVDLKTRGVGGHFGVRFFLR